MTKMHVICKKLRPEERDVYRSVADENYWEEVRSEEVDVGSTAHYLQDLDEAGTEAFRQASNLISLDPVQIAQAHGATIHGEESAQYTLPDPATLAYMRADKLPPECDGNGVTVIGGDTGMAAVVAGKLKAAGVRVLAGADYTGKGSTEDGNGHGSGTGAMCVLGTRASYMSHKVLGDNGSGGSDGIVKSFYAAGDYAASNPDEEVIYNGSFGADSDDAFQPYEQALKYATDRGAVFVFSAGNSNLNILGSPSNASRRNQKVFSSIAFDKESDTRAGFSNYDEDGTLSGPGVREVGYSNDGNLYYLSGTSFSAPCTSHVLIKLISKYGQAAVTALAKNGRDSREPTREEGGGAVDAASAYAKLRAARKPDPKKPGRGEHRDDMRRWSLNQLVRIIDRRIERSRS